MPGESSIAFINFAKSQTSNFIDMFLRTEFSIVV